MGSKDNYDLKEGFTKVLWSHTELAAGMHLSRGHLYRLLDGGQMLPPDVIIPPDSYGWEPERSLAFGRDAERLDANGRPTGPAVEGSLAKAEKLVSTTYATTPKLYLSSWYASYLYGLKESAVYFVRQRGNFIPADVLIGKNKYGWDEERVIEFGEQTGRLDDEKIDTWVIRRTEEFGLSPTADWVKRRVIERSHLSKPLKEAVEASQAAAS